MKHKHKHKKEEKISKFNLLLHRRIVIASLLILICVIGIPLRAQNIKLNGYISDDAWWHYRHIKDVYTHGHRLNPDSCEFVTLNRPMTYAPLFHYLVGDSYKLFDKILPLIQFTHYFNIFEAMLYILLIYGISFVITNDGLSSLIGALAASVSYGFIIRARAGELMPFVPGDLFALGSILLLLLFVKYIINRVRFVYQQGKSRLKDIIDEKCILLLLAAGILLGLSLLSWSGSALIYLPLGLFVFVALVIAHPKLIKLTLALFSIYLFSCIVISLPWYLPLILKYGINPHTKEMAWFMQGFTVLHQVKPLNFYIFTSGISIFFIPVVLLLLLFRRNTINIFIILWILLAVIATYSGWRGYVAVVPIISTLAISISVSRIVRFFCKENSFSVPVIFIILFLCVGIIGYRISAAKLEPLDSNNTDEVRANGRSMKMLEFIHKNYPDSVTVDHVTWVSEDEALGKCRMIHGQYLEYLPVGSSQIFIDAAKIYFVNEEEAYKICKKYNVDLIIARMQFLRWEQLSILFAPKELKLEDYVNVTKESNESQSMTLNFTPRGTQTVLFQMLNCQKLKRFELIYRDQNQGEHMPFLVVYKVQKNSEQVIQ